VTTPVVLTWPSRSGMVTSADSKKPISSDGMYITPATAFEGRTARGNLGWWWLRVRGRHGP
jgi:hypothetical protein